MSQKKDGRGKALWLIVTLLVSLVIFVFLVKFLAPTLPKPEPKVLNVSISEPIKIQLVVPEKDVQKQEEEGYPRFTGGAR